MNNNDIEKKIDKIINKNFIKDQDILEENHKTNDLLDFSEIIENFKKRLDKIQRNAIVGLVGKFGSGKSTMLYQLYKDQQNDSSEKWIEFDAWKFPERNDLWEGFVLELADQIGDKNKILNKIDGKDTKSKTIDVITDVLSAITDKLSGLNFLDKFIEIFKKSPATRVFEIQKILKAILEKINKDIYIIIEDIDRSDDRGIYFLETLNNFIKKNNFDKKIIVIVPISDKKFENKKDSYYKTLDYIFYFKPNNINFTNFIDAIFEDDILNSFNHCKDQLDYLFKQLIKVKDLTPREIKHILRITNNEYQKFEDKKKQNIDIRMLIFFACVHHCKDKMWGIINDKKGIREDFWGKNFLFMVAKDIDEKELKNYTLDIRTKFFLVDNHKLNFPKFDDFIEDQKGYYISDQYLDCFN